MAPLDLLIAAIISAGVSAGVAWPIARNNERRAIQREAASQIERELESLAADLGEIDEWWSVWNRVLEIRNRHEGRLHDVDLEERLDAISTLANFLQHRREEESPAGHRLPSTSTMFLAIQSARDGLSDYLLNVPLRAPTFPVGARLAELLAEWQTEGTRPRALRP